MPDLQSSISKPRFVLVAAILGSGMVFLDGTVVNLALPALQQSFGATVPVVQWIVEAYALTLASLLLVGGTLGDHFGHRRIYIGGTILFALSSIACGLAVSSAWLIAARTMQGIGGALLVPGSLALLTLAYPETERGRAIGTWSAFSAITTAIGPIAGGWLIEHLSWRWVFFLNIPIALAVILLCLKFAETHIKPPSEDVDWAGAILTTTGLGGIIYVLIEWPSSLHHSLLTALAFGSLMTLAGMIQLERHAQSPMIPSNVFRSRNFTGANVLTFLIYAPLGALLFFTPLDLIQVQHYSATKAGTAFTPFVVVMLIFSRWAGQLVERHGARLPLTIGPAVAAVGYITFAMLPQDGRYWASFFPGVVITAAGMMLIVAPLTTTVMGSVPYEYTGIASGINNAVSRLASLLAVAAFGALLVVVFVHTLDHQLLLNRVPLNAAKEVKTNQLQLGAIRTVDIAAQRAIETSFIHAYRFVLWTAAIFLLLGALTGWVLIGKNDDETTGI